MPGVAERCLDLHCVQQLHAVIAGDGIAEGHLRIVQFRRAATQLLAEADGALALADDQQLAEAGVLDGITVDGIEAQGPALVAARGRWHDIVDTGDFGRHASGVQERHAHFAAEQRPQRQAGAGAVGVQYIHRVVHMAAHVHVPGDDMPRQQGDGRTRAHHELLRLAVGGQVEQRRIEEDVARQQIERVNAGNAPGQQPPAPRPVGETCGKCGHLGSSTGGTYVTIPNMTA